MNNFSQVGSKSFKYRLIARELLAIMFLLLMALVLGSGIYMLHVHNFYLYLLLGVVLLFLCQLGLVFGFTHLEYKNLEYLIETNSISLREGILSSHTETIPFEKIKNSSFDQSLPQRFFSVGNITIDQDDEKYIWPSIDADTAHIVMEAVSAKSNIQPIMVSANNSMMASSSSSQPQPSTSTTSNT